MQLLIEKPSASPLGPIPSPPGFESLARQLTEIQESVNALPDRLSFLMKQRRQSEDSSCSDDETWQPAGGMLSMALRKCIEEEEKRPSPAVSRRVSRMSVSSSMASKSKSQNNRINSVFSAMSADSSILSSALRSGPLLGSQVPSGGGGRRRGPGGRSRENSFAVDSRTSSIASRTNSVVSNSMDWRKNSVVSNSMDWRKNSVVSNSMDWRKNSVISANISGLNNSMGGLGGGDLRANNLPSAPPPAISELSPATLSEFSPGISGDIGRCSVISEGESSNGSNENMEQKPRRGGGSNGKRALMERQQIGSSGPALHSVLPGLDESEESLPTKINEDDLQASEGERSAQSEKKKVWSLRMTTNKSLRAVNSLHRQGSMTEVQADEDPSEDTPFMGLATWLQVLDPESTVSFLWNLIMMLDLIFLGVALPLQVAYLETALPPGWAGLLHLSDALLIADVLWNLIVPWDTGMELLVHPLDIFFRYAQSWLLLDLIAAMPLLDAAGPVIDAGGTVLRVMKVGKCWKLAVYFTRVQACLSSGFLSYVKIFLPLLLAFHFFACIFRCILRAEDAENVPLGEQSVGRSYVDDLYWLVMTMTSVGYGDVSVTSFYGRVYAIVVMFASSFYTGFTVSSTSSALKKLFDDRVESQVNRANSFMNRHHMPAGLRHRVENHLRNKKATNDSSVSETAQLLELLSPSLQKELSRELLSNMLMGFPMLSQAPESLIAQLAQAHTWVHALTGELVVEEGQVEQELMFVATGRLTMLRVDPFTEQLEEESLGTASWFGERCLFLANSIREFTVVAEEDAELAYLHISEFQRILALFPEIQKQLVHLTELVDKGKLDVRDLQYVPPETQDEQKRCCLLQLLRPQEDDL